MHVLLRADASITQGTGHVMRCLTLSEALIASGHHVTLMTNNSEIPWLEARIYASGVSVQHSPAHTLNLDKVLALAPDWVVVDSYVIPAIEISELSEHLNVLAIVDGDARGIDAQIYLDHNIGSEKLDWPDTVRAKLLAGSDYTLIRDAILEVKREQPWVWPKTFPRLLAVMGGSDPLGAITVASEVIAALQGEVTATIVASPEWHSQVLSTFKDVEAINVILPTPNLPGLLSNADIAISAAGTSSWELCSLGIPSVLIAVADNQLESLTNLADHRLALTVNLLEAGRGEAIRQAISALRSLMASVELRKSLSSRSTITFDGKGKNRVVSAMVNHDAPLSKESGNG